MVLTQESNVREYPVGWLAAVFGGAMGFFPVHFSATCELRNAMGEINFRQFQ
jgi:hypothetical protein